MNSETRPSEPDKVACEVCLKQVPASEAQSEEATDYVVHFCGLDCHEKWKAQQEEKKE